MLLINFITITKRVQLITNQDDLSQYGVFPNVPEHVYHSLDLFSNSKAGKILDVPASLKIPFPETEALRFGRAFHSAILEPKIFETDYIEMPAFDKRTEIGKLADLEFREANQGKEYLKNGEVRQIQCMRESIMLHPLMNEMFSAGEAETTIFWKDKKTGIDCKCRIDWIPSEDNFKGLLTDVKTAKDASFEGFHRAIRDRRYHMQAAVYMQARNLFLPRDEQIEGFVIPAVEKTPPYRFNPYIMFLDGDYCQKGLEDWNRALEIELKCRQQNQWDSYNVADDEIRELIAPGWF